MDRAALAKRHAALGDERRLLIVDELALTDRTFAELESIVGLPGNLLAHHLEVLESAGLIGRRTSEGDRRRRYLSLNWEILPGKLTVGLPHDSTVAFICTHNSARSQFAAALWQELTGSGAASAGTEPATGVHPTAIHVAREFGLDLSEKTPSGYDTLPDVGVLISVCDRANEAIAPAAPIRLHWSVADPVTVGTAKAFRSAFEDISRRIKHLALQTTA